MLDCPRFWCMFTIRLLYPSCILIILIGSPVHQRLIIMTKHSAEKDTVSFSLSHQSWNASCVYKTCRKLSLIAIKLNILVAAWSRWSAITRVLQLWHWCRYISIFTINSCRRCTYQPIPMPSPFALLIKNLLRRYTTMYHTGTWNPHLKMVLEGAIFESCEY